MLEVSLEAGGPQKVGDLGCLLEACLFPQGPRCSPTFRS